MAMLALAGCGHNDIFRVKGTVADGASINLRFVYYTDGAVRTGLTASIDGKFEFEGNAPEVSAVEVYDNEYRLLARFLASNGEDIDLRINRKNIYQGSAGGNDLNIALTEFFNANAETLNKPDSPERNQLIAEYVATHPQSPVSQLLIASELDASSETGVILADSLTNLLAPEARSLAMAESFADLKARITDRQTAEPITAITFKVKGNRVETFATQRSPLSLIAINDATHGHDSVIQTFRELERLKDKGRIALLELSVDTDTMTWVRSIRNDSASWTQGWAAGSISGQSIGRLGIPAIPYFILTDSTGTQLWRGRSASEALETAKSY